MKRDRYLSITESTASPPFVAPSIGEVSEPSESVKPSTRETAVPSAGELSESSMGEASEPGASQTGAHSAGWQVPLVRNGPQIAGPPRL